MATRTLTYTEWLKLVKRHASDNGLPNVVGYPVAEVAYRLDVHRSRVHQLIQSGVLDSLAITTRSGSVAMTLVTEASIERYLADRVPDRGRQGYFAFSN